MTKSHLRNSSIGSHLKLELSLSFCSTNLKYQTYPKSFQRSVKKWKQKIAQKSQFPAKIEFKEVKISYAVIINTNLLERSLTRNSPDVYSSKYFNSKLGRSAVKQEICGRYKTHSPRVVNLPRLEISRRVENVFFACLPFLCQMPISQKAA